MVSFLPFRELIKKRGITTYYLRNKCGEYNLGNKTIERLMNDQSVSTNTIDALCQILDCEVTDIMEIKRDGGKKPAEGKSMTFSEFATMLRPYCGNGTTKADFVILLTDKIMKGQPGRAHADDTFQNPLRGKDNRTLELYFSGERTISDRAAGILFSSHDKYKFEEYLRSQCSDDALEQLEEELEAKTGVAVKGDPVEVCADLFVEILKDLAKV